MKTKNAFLMVKKSLKSSSCANFSLSLKATAERLRAWLQSNFAVALSDSAYNIIKKNKSQ